MNVGTPLTACGHGRARSHHKIESTAIGAWWLARQNGVPRENSSVNENAATATTCDATEVKIANIVSVEVIWRD